MHLMDLCPRSGRWQNHPLVRDLLFLASGELKVAD